MPHSNEIPARTRSAVYARARFCCQRCGSWLGKCGVSGRCILRRSLTAGNDLNNLVLLCVACSSWIADNADKALSTGWVVANRSALPLVALVRSDGSLFTMAGV